MQFESANLRIAQESFGNTYDAVKEQTEYLLQGWTDGVAKSHVSLQRYGISVEGDAESGWTVKSRVGEVYGVLTHYLGTRALAPAIVFYDFAPFEEKTKRFLAKIVVEGETAQVSLPLAKSCSYLGDFANDPSLTVRVLKDLLAVKLLLDSEWLKNLKTELSNPAFE